VVVVVVTTEVRVDVGETLAICIICIIFIGTIDRSSVHIRITYFPDNTRITELILKSLGAAKNAQ
jgi:hypothetical protein